MADIDIEARTRVSVPDDWSDLDRRAVDTIRVLAADAVQKVGNGHPGTAMSLAPAAYLLFQRFLRHDPTDPGWLGREPGGLFPRGPGSVRPPFPSPVVDRLRGA